MERDNLKIAGLCVFRNAVDLIGLVILHHLTTVVDFVYCVDNGSSDGSSERIELLRRRTSRVSVIFDPTIRQKREYMTALARHAHRDGFNLILPFDSDELWHGTRVGLREALQGHNVVRCPVLNFIQRRSVESPSLFSWQHAIRRCATTDTLGTRVKSGEISFFECEFPSKVAFLADAAAELDHGQHGVSRPNHREAVSTSIAILHLPVRAKSELLKRVYDYESRIEKIRPHPDLGWQGLYWRDRVLGGETDSEWEALSYDRRGDLLIRQRRLPTFIDCRLVGHLYHAAFTTRYGCIGLQML